MNYKEFFQIAINHPYFSDNQMELVVIPEASTLKFLRKQQFVVKNTAKGLKILVPVDSEGDRLPVLKLGDALSFDVFPTTGSFGEVTDTSMADSGNILLFTNEQLENDSEKLTVSEITGDQILNGYAAIAKIKIGLHKVNFDLDKQPPLYQVVFKPKLVKWKYYILSNTETTKLEIKDRSEQLTFTELKNQEEASDKIANSLMLNFPKKQVFVFESTIAINYSNKILKNIQLLKNDHIIIKHLSNPDIRNKGIQIIKIN
ncbi:hypothetical protein [Ascidiimonas sp. W6]|uniref:hypothetical protein n=1 Tax=Ascidiimonas meishanensis TaxID=3128903 RepID=UPI0030ED5246